MALWGGSLFLCFKTNAAIDKTYNAAANFLGISFLSFSSHFVARSYNSPYHMYLFIDSSTTSLAIENSD